LRKIRKFLFWLVLLFTLIFGSVSLYLYYHQDKLIKTIITEINKRVDVPISVGKIAINWYQDFPNISIVCNDVKIQEAIKGSDAYLAELQQLAFSFDLLSLFRGDYTFDRVRLKNGTVTILTTKKGERNYLILKKSSDSKKKDINFDLNKIEIEKVDINYIDENLKQSYYLFAEKLDAKLNKDDEIYQIEVKGDLETKKLSIQEMIYFRDKQLNLSMQLTYDEDKEQLSFDPSIFKVNKNAFSIAGLYKLENSYFNLKIDGIDTDIRTITSLLPYEFAQTIGPYEALGMAKFHGTIIGELSATNSPLVNMDFNVKNAYMKEPTYKTEIDSLSFTGSFTNGQQHSLKTSKLTIENAKALIKGRPIIASFQLSNFNHLYLRLATSGSISTQDLFGFLPISSEFKDLTGDLDFNLSLEGYIDDFEKASTAHKISNSGELSLHGVGGTYKAYPLPFKDFSGRLLFNKNDIAINSLSGEIGVSDIRMDGFFLNIIPYLLNDSESLLIEADTKSKYIDLNELLSGLSNETYSKEKQQASYKFSISPSLQLDLKSEIDHLIFQRFNGNAISGRIQVKDQTLVANPLKMNTMGGNIMLSGTIDTAPQNGIDILTTANFNQLNIDSIFYTFYDFNQDFLTQQHLKGRINADVLAHTVLDKSLNFIPEAFEASILASVKEGKLINFGPMQSLSDYVNEKDLANLSFGELKNSIQIKNKTIYLPEMIIKSNVSEIQVQGTHTFDQVIDYKLLVPLKNYKRLDKDAEFGAIEETDEYTKLFLKITGTTDDFTVSWDGKKTMNAVGGKLKEEAKNIKSLITGKGIKKENKKEIEVTEDDYFDW
jgi:uncharacterized protein involved in outer membrane biogenesis